MRITWKDGVTTVMAVVIAAIFAAQALAWSWPLLADVRSATLAVGIIGLGMCAVGSDPTAVTSKSAYTVLAGSLGGAALILAVVGVISGWPVVFTGLVLVTELLYVIATTRHLLGVMPAPRHA